MTKTWEKLTLTTLDRQAHDKTCNYWYLIKSAHTANTAFTKRECLLSWLSDMGLELTEELPAHGEISCQRIKGKYREQMHWSYDYFYSLHTENTITRRTVSNGDYTMGIITTDGGIKTIHTLNPNCKHRPKYNYEESRMIVC